MYTNNNIETSHLTYRRRRVPSQVLSILCLLFSGQLFLTFTINTSYATTYYLDAVNGNDLNIGTSSNTPWQSLTKAQSVLQGGDTVVLSNGNYGDFIENSVVARNDWVTYQAKNEHMPVFSMIYISNLSKQDAYLRFDGIKIEIPISWYTDHGYNTSQLNDWPDNPYGGGPFPRTDNCIEITNANYVYLKNCKVQGIQKYLTTAGAWVTSSDHVTIEHCDISTVEIPVRSRGCYYFSALYNHIHHYSAGSGIGLVPGALDPGLAFDVLVEGNHIHAQSYVGTDAYYPDSLHGGSGIAVKHSSVTLRNNIIHNLQHGQGILVYPQYTQKNHLFENNLVYDYSNFIGFSNLSGPCIFRNNTFISKIIDDGAKSGGNYLNVLKRYGGMSPFLVDFASGFDGTGVEIHNNIIVGFWDIPDPTTTNYVENNNIWWVKNPSYGYNDLAGSNSIVAVWLENSVLHGYPEFFEDLGNGFTQWTPEYPSGSNHTPFFVDPGYYFYDEHHSVPSTKDSGITWDYHLAPNSPGINFGDASKQPSTSLGTIGPDGFIRNDGPSRDATHHSAGCYEYTSGPIDNTPPTEPQNLTATAVSESQIDLSWNASTDPESGISYYKIYRDGAGTHIDTSVSTSYSDTGLNAGTPHSYQVSAVNGQNIESNKSNTGSATTLADTTPPTIQSVSASETSLAIVFSETLNTNSAENKDLYTIKSGTSDIPVMAASLGVDLITVTLTTSPHVEGSYTLTVEAVRDIAGNPIVSASIDYMYTIGLIGYWKFDEASGNTAFDSSGSGHDGTLVNGPTWTTGKIGSALLFDGTNNYVDIGAPDIAYPWTASFWVKREDSSNSNAALLDSSNYSLKLEQYPNLNKVGVSAYGVADYVFNYEAPIGKWAHLVFVGTQTQVALYVDATLAETIAASISCPMAQISSASRAIKGTVDEVRTYNRALNAAEVSKLYEAGNTNPVTHTLVVWASNGSVTKIPDKASYNHGEEVTLQPEPDTGYSFANWSGDLTGSSNPATIVMDADKSVTANFTITVNTYTLNITADEDEGYVTKTPDQARYDNGTTVTLQAMANNGYSFTGWSGGASGTNNPTTVVMDGNKSVTANFTINTYTLDITATNGSVAKIPDQVSYNYGTTVTLQAMANNGYSFAGWSGDASGTNNPTTVVMDGNKSVTANFTINTYTISASAGSNGQINPDGITQVNYGDSQAYTITANPGYKISNVLVDGSSVGAVTSHSFTNVTANHTIAVSFVIDEIDVTSPTVTNLSPQADSIQAQLNTLITLDITDSGDGVDANSVTIKVSNDTVYSGNTDNYSSAYGECYRTGTKADYTFIYQSKEKFNFDQTISVKVNASDLASNSMDEYSYYFKTKMRAFGKNKKVNKDNNLSTDSAEFASIVNNNKPKTCCDSKGNIWATWHAGPTSNKDIYINKLTAGSEVFGDSIKLTDNPADQRNPTIAVGNGDKLYIAWQDNGRGNWDIYLSTSSDGINFSTEIRVTDSNDNQINPAIVVDSSNNAYIVWEDDRNDNKDIYVASSNNDFVTKTVSQITLDNSNQVEPAVAADSDNKVYVVWTDTRNSNNDIYGAASNNGPWTNIPIVNTGDSQSSPAIATEDVGSILHIVWVDDRLGNNDIFYDKTTGGLAPLNGTSIIDDTKGTDQQRPTIAVSGNTGNNLQVFVSWEDERNTDYDLYFAELGSGSGTNVFVGDDETNSGQTEPALGIDRDGDPYLVWTDSRNMNTDIYYAGSTSIEATALASGNISTSSTTTVETADGVSVVVPAGAYPCDIEITISEVKNPPSTSKEYLSLPYDFGPSGIEFDLPVTITIPYEVPASGYSVSAYWYNLLTATPSQQGITDIETIVISSTTYLRFKTMHFTQFFVGGSFGSSSVSVSGGGGGGGCSMSANSQASALELLLPYIGLTVTMVILKIKDRRKSKTHNIT